LSPRSIARLPASGACVAVDPPFIARGASPGSIGMVDPENWTTG
jgi:hypothetical protein